MQADRRRRKRTEKEKKSTDISAECQNKSHFDDIELFESLIIKNVFDFMRINGLCNPTKISRRKVLFI